VAHEVLVVGLHVEDVAVILIGVVIRDRRGTAERVHKVLDEAVEFIRLISTQAAIYSLNQHGISRLTIRWVLLLLVALECCLNRGGILFDKGDAGGNFGMPSIAYPFMGEVGYHQGDAGDSVAGRGPLRSAGAS
jgi:hypothetical protein